MHYDADLRFQLFLTTLPITIILALSIIIAFRYLKKHSEHRETAFYIILLTLISTLPEINDFLRTGAGHDFLFNLDRIENIKNGLLAGQFPVRLNYYSTGNAGTATPSMYPEIFLYIPAVLRLIQVPQIFALKFFHLLINLACVCISYFSVSRITKSKNIGLIFSAVYTLCLYRLVNIYLRHAIGEAQAMVFFPLVMLGIYELMRREHKYWYLLAIGITGVIQSHIISAFLMALYLFAYFLYSIKFFNKERCIALIKTVILVLCLNIWFIIPFFTYYNMVDPPGYRLLPQSAVYPEQLFAGFIKNSGDDLYTRGTIFNEMPLTLGGIIGLGLVAFIYMVFVYKNKKTGIEKMGKISFIFGMAALLPATVFFPWYEFNLKVVGIFYAIQYPWRFLAIAAPLLSFTAAIGIYLLLRKLKIKKRLSVFIAVCLCILGSAFYMESVNNTDNNLMALDTADPWRHGDYKYKSSDLAETHEYANLLYLSHDSLSIMASEKNFDLCIVSLESSQIIPEELFIEFPFYNFPGYTAELNGKKLPILNGNNNFIRVILPQNFTNGDIKVYYKRLNGFIIGDIISGLTVLAVLAYISRKKIYRLVKKKG